MDSMWGRGLAPLTKRKGPRSLSWWEWLRNYWRHKATPPCVKPSEDGLCWVALNHPQSTSILRRWGGVASTTCTPAVAAAAFAAFRRLATPWRSCSIAQSRPWSCEETLGTLGWFGADEKWEIWWQDMTWCPSIWTRGDELLYIELHKISLGSWT